MLALIIGLVLFLGVHSVRVFAEPWRQACMARMGPGGWKIAYSVASLAGLALLAWGFGQARAEPVVVWQPPAAAGWITALLMLPAFTLLFAAYVPGNRLKGMVGQPMMAGVALWALAHLFANGRLADLLLFGSFLAWSLLAWRSASRRDRAAGTVRAAGSLRPTIMTLVYGTMAWGAFGAKLHLWLIGVQPLG